MDFNGDNGETLPDVHGTYVPSMFDVAHDHGVATALYASKPKFNFLLRSWDAERGAVDRIGEDDGRDKVDRSDIGSALSEADAVVDTVTGAGPRLTFWHVPNPDNIGHAAGWMTDPYLQAVIDADRVIGQVLVDALERPGVPERLTVLLTADHGGPPEEKKHDDRENAANYTIPFMAWGARADDGVDLYDLNPERADPGVDRPDFDGLQPVRNIDVARTALSLLGLEGLDDTVSSEWPALALR